MRLFHFFSIAIFSTAFLSNPYAGEAFTAADVATHNTAGNCWEIISNTIYDFTNYANNHPGGVTQVTNACGTDATQAYQNIGSHKPAKLANTGGITVIGALQAAATTLPPTKVAPTQTVVTVAQTTQPPVITPTTQPPANTPTTQTGATTFTAATLSAHNTAANCYVAISGNVYDLSTGAYTHPGGAGQITPTCGTDGTAAYTNGYAAHQPAKLSTSCKLVGTFTAGGTTPTTLPPTVTPTTAAGPTTVAPTTQIIPPTTVSTHNTPADCWVIINAVVYDLSTAAYTHPGGPAQIAPTCGTDGTAAYTNGFNGHLPSKLSTSCKVLGVTGQATVILPGPASPAQPSWISQNMTAFLCIVIIGGLFAVALIIHFITSELHRMRLKKRLEDTKALSKANAV